MSLFKLHSSYQPTGDQPGAIDALEQGLAHGQQHQTLLGVTGSGKTFTMANVIARIQKPTLVIAHNKTLAAQLAAEYREFFPESAVHYFVSYYDYYQPEAYVPTSDTYIEKEAMVNEDIERLRHAATQALLTRRDVIIVASVSCIYGLGSPEEYEKVNLKLAQGQRVTRAALTRQLISMYFERTTADLTPGTFRAVGSSIEVMPANERVIQRINLTGGQISSITELDAMTREERAAHEALFLFPAKHYVTPQEEREAAIKDMQAELKTQLVAFQRAGKVLEAERLKRRTRQDIALIKEFGYCNGIENYSRHFDRRAPGTPPHTLLSYFPHKKDGSADFLTIIDESHVTVSQIGAMYAGDRSRKETLIEHGFRLPSALDNRPLTFQEFSARVGQTIYTSATPGKYELEHSGASDCSRHDHLLDPTKEKPKHDTANAPHNCALVEMIVRPTGLVDPKIDVRPVTGLQEGQAPTPLSDSSEHSSDAQSANRAKVWGQVQDFINEAEAVTKRGARSLVTVLTKKMAEDLTEFLKERSVRATYIHSDVKTVERIEILRDFRQGEFDVLVGVNLLREGLDLPEVELVCILDADKEGFLRSEVSLIQTMGRAARNVAGRVILYADVMTGSLKRAIDESKRRRTIQLAYNKEHSITPKTVQAKIKDITGDIQKAREKAVSRMVEMDTAAHGGNIKALVKEKREQMHKAAEQLDFETAALLRDEIKKIEEKAKQKKK